MLIVKKWKIKLKCKMIVRITNRQLDNGPMHTRSVGPVRVHRVIVCVFERMICYCSQWKWCKNNRMNERTPYALRTCPYFSNKYVIINYVFFCSFSASTTIVLCTRFAAIQGLVHRSSIRSFGFTQSKNVLYNFDRVRKASVTVTLTRPTQTIRDMREVLSILHSIISIRK